MFTRSLVAIVLAISSTSLAPRSLYAQDGQVSTHAPQACWVAADLAARDGEDTIVKERIEPPLPQPASVDAAPAEPRALGSVRSVRLPPGKKLIALTFDLCEGVNEVAGYQGKIVDILRDDGVKATFFMSGKWMMTHKARAQQLISDARFEVGNHTWEHRNLRLLSSPDAADEIRKADQAYDELRHDLEARKCAVPGRQGMADEIAPKSMGLFRFPYGACDSKSLATVGRQGLVPIQWDVSSDDPDWKERPDAMTKKVLDNVHPGSIVLFHANGRGWYTDDALPDIISSLRKQGYDFVTVTELLKAGEPVISSSCYDQTVGDTDQYDELARQIEAH
ncbi:polysaccharide deacetylase family protein [uncultured Bradyrhizobium sp.]|uniref:polysaccharide deacetylase family protein n=1 Tax=uncultured Bradyrhizobium sp. TaxID=199684 RepID=UPI00260CEE5E|nr:polysaccharide deacetylase family protein [uncultured Bradyrhizobium sp.]